MNFIDLIKDHEKGYGPLLLRFESYWNTYGKNEFPLKENAWIEWLHQNWKFGQISTDDLRYLILIETEYNEQEY